MAAAAAVLQRFLLFSLLLAISILLSPALSHDDDFVVALKQTKPLLKLKTSQFRVYWHDIVSGKNPTSVRIVNPPAASSKNGFGLISMIDNPLTLGPDLGSKLVGRAEGFYALASQRELGLLMSMNFVIQYGKYNGSTITILGRNNVMNKMREMPVVGGSGLFRFATGYAQARTHWFDLKTGDATVEYTVYVSHY